MPPAGAPGGPDVTLTVSIASKAYSPGTEVLRDLRFALTRGETAALVGPSGCGKTTLMRLIAGIDPHFSGTIDHAGAARLGMVFQEPRLLPWRNVEQNVRLAAPLAQDGALDALFTALGLDAHRLHYPGQLSLGLARRVAIARALAVAPDLLLLDEPFVSLDHVLAERLRGELAGLVAARGITTLLVTHDIDEALRLANRIFLLCARPARIVDEIGVDAATDAAMIHARIAATLDAAR